MKKHYLRILMFLLLVSLVPGLAHAQQKRILMVVTGISHFKDGKPTGLWLEEYAVPYLLFEKAGFDITVASTKGGKTPIDPRSLTDAAKVYDWAPAIVHLNDTAPLSKVGDAAYDAVFIAGGHGAIYDMPANGRLIKILDRLVREDKVIGAVCHGPGALMGVTRGDGAPLVAGKRVTSFTDDEEKAVGLDKAVPFPVEGVLREKGAKFVVGEKWRSHVEVDGKLVTGQNPASSEAVAKAVIEALK